MTAPRVFTVLRTVALIGTSRTVTSSKGREAVGNQSVLSVQAWFPT